MTVGSFIKSVAKKHGTSAAQIERDLGFSNGYIGNASDNSFPHSRLLMIADHLGVSPEYLWSLGKSDNPSASLPPSLSDDESSLLSLFGKLDAADQGRVLGYIDGLLAASKYKKAGSPAVGESDAREVI